MNAHENDESVLIDACLNQLDEHTSGEVGQRLERDEQFRRLHQDVKNSLAALGILPEAQPPDDLVARTLARIRQVRQTDALIAREEMGRNVLRPTFTLREAVAVAAALLIVASVFVPSIRQAGRERIKGICASNVGQVGAALMSYANSNNNRLPTADGMGSRWMGSSGQSAVSNSSALFKLVREGYAPQVIFLCPGAKSTQPFTPTQQMRDFPSGQNVNYSFQHSLGNRAINFSDPKYAAVVEKMAIYGDDTPFYRNGVFRPEQVASATSENHGRSGMCVLYLGTMNVKWVRQPTVGVDGNNIYIAEGIYKYKGDETPVSPTDTFLLPAYSGAARSN